MVRKSVRQQEALRRARERQRAREAAETQAPEGPRVPEAMLNRRPTETDRRRLAAATCGWCDGPIEIKARGRIPKWCSAACRQRAWEQSRAADLRSLRDPGGRAARRGPGRDADPASGTSAARGVGRRAQ